MEDGCYGTYCALYEISPHYESVSQSRAYSSLPLYDLLCSQSPLEARGIIILAYQLTVGPLSQYGHL